MKLFSILIIIPLLFCHRAIACTPCARDLSPKEAFKEADLVVIAKRIFDSKTNTINSETRTQIEIKEILKGSIVDRKMSVQGSYGMCYYGLLIPDSKDYLIFLKRNHDQYETFEAKGAGCAPMPVVEKGNVFMKNDKKTPLKNYIGI